MRSSSVWPVLSTWFAYQASLVAVAFVGIIKLLENKTENKKTAGLGAPAVLTEWGAVYALASRPPGTENQK